MGCPIRKALARAGQTLHLLSRAQAQWEIQTGREILARRKKLLLAALAPVVLALVWSSAAGQTQPRSSAGSSSAPAVACSAAAPPLSAGELPEKIPVLGGSKAFVASAITTRMFLGSILVGLIAGLITGVIGAGGGYILTPALMSFGVRGIMSVGTDQFHLFAKAMIGTAVHRKMGNVNIRLAIWFVVGSCAGVTAGGKLSRAIFQHSPAMSDAVISGMYVLVLGILGLYAVGDWLRLRRGQAGAALEATTDLARWLQRLPLRPRVSFDENIVPGGRRIPVYPVIACGLIVGFVAAIMGVGGGFLTFPMFVYGMGVSTFTTVGTDILQIIFTTAYSSIFQYAIYGFVFYTVAVGMLVGSLVGVQLGAMVTKTVKGSQIRAFYALTILAGFLNRACALPRKLADLGYVSLSRQASVVVEQVGVVLFFGIVGAFAVWIVAVFIMHLGRMRADRAGQPLPAGGPLVVDRAKLGLGLAGVGVFLLVLAAGAVPWAGDKPALTWTDDFFNRLAKHSANYISDGRRRSAALADCAVDLGIQPREFVNTDRMGRVIRRCGASAAPTADGRTRIQATLGQLASAASNDAELMFVNDVAALRGRYDMDATEVIYCWWCVFDGLGRRYVQENRPAQADLAKFLSGRVLEPAYNFRGIQAQPVRENALPLAGLLGFYVLYTLWYGVSIMLIFEGLGITASLTKGRREA